MSDYISRDAVMRVYHEMDPGVPVVGGQGRWKVMGEKLEAIPSADVVPVVHARWVRNPNSDDGFTHHMCSKCKTDAPFNYVYVEDYDEGIDGEWYPIGQCIDHIEEHMGNFCPNCGAKMDGE